MRIFRNPRAARCINRVAAFSIGALWAAHLAYPMHRLQYSRWIFLGYQIPIYYFFNVFLVLGMASCVLLFKRAWSRWELMWWMLPIICLPGIFRSADHLWSVRECLSWMIRGVIPGGILFLTVRRRRALTMLVCGIYPVVVLATVLGLVEIFYHHNPIWDGFDNAIPQISQPSNPFYRPRYGMAPDSVPRGTQGNRIPYMATLVGFLPISLWLTRYSKRRTAWIWGGTAGALFSILLLARVRSIWMGALAAFVLMPVVSLQRGWREICRMLIGIFLGLGIFISIPQTRHMLRPRFRSFHFSDHSIRNRLDLLATGVILKDRGLLGVGFGQYAAACGPYYKGERWLPYFNGETWTGSPDNQILRWTIENGIPSLGLLLAFVVGLIRACWKEIRAMKDVQSADFYKSVLVGWVSVTTTFLFFDGFYWGACNMTFWCLLGLFATSLARETADGIEEF